MTVRDVVVVIGCGGMGAAVVRRIGTEATVVLADTDRDALSAVATELRGEGLELVTMDVDVSEADSVVELAGSSASHGRIAAVVHTAGLSPAQATPAEIVRVDLVGTAHVLDAFGRVIGAGGAGVCIASMAGTMASLPAEFEQQLASTPTRELMELPGLSPAAVSDSQTAYVIAKRANQLRVQVAAATWGARGARVNSVSPGIIATAMGEVELAGPAGDVMRAMIAGSATGRIGTPEDIAAAVEFLVGPDSSFVTGTDLLVDGGVVASLRDG